MCRTSLVFPEQPSCCGGSIPWVVWMSALAVLSGTGMLITTFRANSLLLKALFAFTFTCRQTFCFYLLRYTTPFCNICSVASTQCCRHKTQLSHSCSHSWQPACDGVQASDAIVVLPACMWPIALMMGRTLQGSCQ